MSFDTNPADEVPSALKLARNPHWSARWPGTINQGVGAMIEYCEWNPTANRAAFEGENHAAATVCVGADGRWHLCEQCAALPQFKRLKKRPLPNRAIAALQQEPSR